MKKLSKKNWVEFIFHIFMVYTITYKLKSFFLFLKSGISKFFKNIPIEVIVLGTSWIYSTMIISFFLTLIFGGDMYASSENCTYNIATYIENLTMHSTDLTNLPEIDIPEHGNVEVFEEGTTSEKKSDALVCLRQAVLIGGIIVLCCFLLFKIR